MSKNKISATAILIVSLLVIVVLVIFSLLDNVKSVKIPAIVQTETTAICARTSGYVVENTVSPNESVQPNKVLLKMENSDLALQISNLKNEKKILNNLIDSTSGGDYISLKLTLLKEKISRKKLKIKRIETTIIDLQENLKIFSEISAAVEKEYNSFRNLYEQKKISAAEFQQKANDYLQTKNKFETMQNEFSLQKNELKIERNELHNLVGNELLYRENPTLLALDYRMKLEEISGKLEQLKLKEKALTVTTSRKGIITKLNFRNGEFVNSGSIIAEISNPDSIFIIAFGNVLTHKKIFVGRKVIIYGSDGTKFGGFVKSVSPLVKPVKAFSSAYGEKSLYNEIEISPNNIREARKHLIPGEKISVRIMF